MPSFCNTSTIREIAESFTLTLNARHNLVSSSSTDGFTLYKGRFPPNVDVVLDSDLVISVSGMVNRTKVSSIELRRSGILMHLFQYLKVNAGPLGIGFVSDIYVDKDDNLVKCLLSSSRACFASSSASLRLESIDVVYAWKPSQRDQDCREDYNPFSIHVYLPLLAALDRAVERFVCLHLVARYPLIFGSWRMKLDMEIKILPSISCSIINIVRRSPNRNFRKRCHQLLASLSQKQDAVTAASFLALQDYLDSTLEGTSHSAVDLDDDSILREAIAYLFKLYVKPTRYKGSKSNVMAREPDELDLDTSYDDIVQTSPPNKALSPDFPWEGLLVHETHDLNKILGDEESSSNTNGTNDDILDSEDDKWDSDILPSPPRLPMEVDMSIGEDTELLWCDTPTALHPNLSSSSPNQQFDLTTPPSGTPPFLGTGYLRDDEHSTLFRAYCRDNDVSYHLGLAAQNTQSYDICGDHAGDAQSLNMVMPSYCGRTASIVPTIDRSNLSDAITMSTLLPCNANGSLMELTGMWSSPSDELGSAHGDIFDEGLDDNLNIVGTTLSPDVLLSFDALEHELGSLHPEGRMLDSEYSDYLQLYGGTYHIRSQVDIDGHAHDGREASLVSEPSCKVAELVLDEESGGALLTVGESGLLDFDDEY